VTLRWTQTPKQVIQKVNDAERESVLDCTITYEICCTNGKDFTIIVMCNEQKYFHLQVTVRRENPLEINSHQLSKIHIHIDLILYSQN